MLQIADLHIHSKYSRACSSNLTLENIAKTAKIKGVDIIATGDFTFPAWFSGIKQQLEEIEQTGLYKLKSDNNKYTKFLLSTELALIYKKNDKCRRIHIMLHAPNLKAVEELNSYLDKNFNIRSDGRPILGMSAEKLCELCFSIHPDFIVYPAHIWTPWFAVFGSKSGFNTMEECFEKWTKKIYAYETGLSSDPEMNWRLSALDKYSILSNSDAHSLPNIGREATIFELEKPSYYNILSALKKKNKLNKIDSTIEFYPEEGMYHYDGHRVCGIKFSPDETKKHNGICPKCKKALTVGVSYRVDELADRPVGYKLKKSPKFYKLIGLDKIIADSMGIKSRSSKKVKAKYSKIIKNTDSEIKILLNYPLEELKKTMPNNIVEGIKKVREGDVVIEPGFDGEYGKIIIYNRNKKKPQQKFLF